LSDERRIVFDGWEQTLRMQLLLLELHAKGLNQHG